MSKKQEIAICIFKKGTNEIINVLKGKEFFDQDFKFDYMSGDRIQIISSMAELNNTEYFFETDALYNKFMDVVGM